MYCPQCGAQNEDNSWHCVRCGADLRRAGQKDAAPLPAEPPQSLYYGAQPPRVPNYLVHSILCTLFCCMPFGVVAIVYAAGVNTKLAAGDYAGAQRSSRSAQNWYLTSVFSGLVGGLVCIGLRFFLAAAV